MEFNPKNRRVLLAASVGAAAALLAFADIKKGDYTPAQLGALQQSAPPEFTTGASFSGSAYPVPAVDLTPGDGLQEVRIYCNTCHSPRYITMQPPLPPATWEAEVNKMNKTFGANIPDDDSRKIIAYLQAHYTVGIRR
jgi:mono/diheme cytochrome c family protein